MNLESGLTVAEAQAQHGMLFHLWIVAHGCGMANQGDWPRRQAAWLVRDYCADKMRETFEQMGPTEGPTDD